MRIKATAAMVALAGFLTSAPADAQDLGPQIQKFGDGIYAYIGKDFKSNTGIILTQDGVVLIDSGHEPTDSRAVMEAVKKLTPMPVRLLIDTEPHPDHTTGHFVFSPPATLSPRLEPASQCAIANARPQIGLQGSPPRLRP
jgi:glyoxylase-like metal-dependent hydrolase (beta-lactamase superfamily II)